MDEIRKRTRTALIVGFRFAPLGEVLPDFSAARTVLQILQVITRVVVIAHCIPLYTIRNLKASHRSKPYHCSRVPELPAGIWNGIRSPCGYRTPFTGVEPVENAYIVPIGGRHRANSGRAGGN